MGDLVDTVEAAKRLGLSASTLNKMRCTGGGPRYSKIASRIKYRVADLEAWVSASARENTSQKLAA
ncbi:MAG: hypothetical protein JWQ16_2545 [Novosphingobium sp.]|nr:hypothetical protein [Novosphingobium sp.]